MISYRDALPTDLPFIVGLSSANSVGPSPDDGQDHMGPDYLAALAAIDADPNHRLIVAEIDGQKVATCHLTFTPSVVRRGFWRLLVESVYVAPGLQGQGIGRQMMEWVHSEAKARGCSLVQLTSNKARADAHRFYRRLGYQQSHEGFKLWL